MAKGAEPEGDGAEVPESAVYGLDRTVARARAGRRARGRRWCVDVGCVPGSRAHEGARDSGADRVDHGLYEVAAEYLGGLVVCDHDAFVDAPCGLDLDALLVGEHRLQPGCLGVGEQLRAGEEGAAGAVERITCAARVSCWSPAGCAAG